MDDIVRRIADIIDHEQFGGDGTLGEQVAERLLPTLTYIWDRAHEVGESYERNFGGRNTEPGSESSFGGRLIRQEHNPFRQYRTKAERQRAVFEAMDLEDELEVQERRHEP